jgi:hypothetical protein
LQKRLQLGSDRVHQRTVDIQLRPAVAIEAWHVNAWDRAIEQHDVGLQAFKAALRNLRSSTLYVGQRGSD